MLYVSVYCGADQWITPFMGESLFTFFCLISFRGTKRQFSENICSEDDLISGIFGTFVVKFLACLPLLGFSEHLKNGIITHF